VKKEKKGIEGKGVENYLIHTSQTVVWPKTGHFLLNFRKHFDWQAVSSH
jgi:hypothetical protein